MTSTPLLRAQAMTVFMDPKSTPTTDIATAYSDEAVQTVIVDVAPVAFWWRGRFGHKRIRLEIVGDTLAIGGENK